MAQKQPSVKKCVIAYPPRLAALKMDGTKQATETLDHESGDRGVF